MAAASLCCFSAPAGVGLPSARLGSVRLRTAPHSRARARARARARQADDAASSSDVDISVFRFTLGIPGFDDAQLPRIVGVVFGGLLCLNHALTAEMVPDAQWRSEGVGLVLASVAILLPNVSQRLKESRSQRRAALTLAQRQIFVLRGCLSQRQKLELAWGSFALLQNSNTTALLVCTASGKVVCARGCWEVEEGVVGDEALLVLEERVKQLTSPPAPLYISHRAGADAPGWGVLSNSSQSLLLQPFDDQAQASGFILAISHVPRAYNLKDRAWVSAIASKFSTLFQ